MGSVAQGQEEPVSIYDGVFTEEQAGRGRTAFGESCAVCHGNTGRGGPDAPGLIAYALDTKYAGQPLWNYYHYMQSTMPLGRPSSLSNRTYADIVAYLLQEHGAEAGDMELEPEEERLQGIMIERKPEE